MKTIRLVAALSLLLFALSISSVFAAGYAVGVPIIGTIGSAAIGAPALNGGTPPVTGDLSFQYADGSPVFLANNIVTLQICTPTVCEYVQSTMNRIAPGEYSYSFMHPLSISGTVTIIVPAYALADENGKEFPSVQTVIGAYSFGSSPTTSNLPTISQTAPPLPLMSQQSSQLYNQAVSPPHPNQGSEVMQVGLAALVLILAAGGLLILPRKHP